jgi:protein-S-isoprenylcysteine O-methyltransferase Ste14
MTNLNKKAFAGLLNLFVVMAASIFLPAWTLHYWQAWLFLAVFFAPSLAITLFLMKRDPKLLERRVHSGAAAEKEKSQKVIQTFGGIVYISILVLPACDHRFAWSAVPAPWVIAGDAWVILGMLAVFMVFKQNTFTSGIIEVAPGQEVISTGPYALVRHPMYAGALVLVLGVPLALGSWWGLLTIIPMTAILIWRLLEEERFLARNLAGYSDYQAKVRYRLAPLIW